MVADGDLDDPLLLFTTQLENRCLEPFSETVSVAGLFACAAAADAADPWALTACFRTRVANADALLEAARPSGWEPLVPDAPFRSGILLLQGLDRQIQAAPAEALRTTFQQHGVAVTTYPAGVARFSLPSRAWKGKELGRLRSVLQSCA
jgi:hypothetical protein